MHALRNGRLAPALLQLMAANLLWAGQGVAVKLLAGGLRVSCYGSFAASCDHHLGRRTSLHAVGFKCEVRSCVETSP